LSAIVPVTKPVDGPAIGGATASISVALRCAVQYVVERHIDLFGATDKAQP
jgi:hypothetical protein